MNRSGLRRRLDTSDVEERNWLDSRLNRPAYGGYAGMAESERA